MTFLDYFVLLIYAAGMLFIGSILSKRNKNSADMFAVSKQAPWWLSGVSAFMSAFSAGTFVVWGGVAYKEGAVAISILMSLGISSFIVGRFLAAKWASLGITSVGEYVNIRFGKAVVQFYTWIGALFKIVAMSVALYAFATLFCSLIPLEDGHFLQDPATGKLSIAYACIASGLLMLVYAVSGGLWAVLIIDSIQFVVLMITVLFVVPLCFSKVGGMNNFLAAVPEGFLKPASGKFTYLFLLGWVVIHAFKFGGEWVFIQRFLAVSNPKNAKRSSYLFGTLYLVSPVIWMLPPMIYRVIDPNANPEQAYFLACAAVLPAGMMGLLLAAMFSSAASYIDGEINVYAGAVTDDFYKLMVNPEASEKQLVLVGRISSFLIGAVIIGGAVLIPYIGGAEKVILTITSLLVVPMVLPVIWGLFFGKITQKAVWIATGASFIAAIIVKTSIPIESSNSFVMLLIRNIQTLEVAVGVLVPLLILILMESTRTEIASGFTKLLQMEKTIKTNDVAVVAAYPAKILAYSIGILSLLMYVLMFSADDKMLLLGSFGVVLSMISLAILFGIKKMEKNK
ncbi:MAG: Na+:solute symporter [Pedobacter sp.]|nr:MAG: Na+:solute symporter [Pedobacter sp.]